MAELLELATKKLDLEVPAKCIFSEEGDAYDADDVELIGADDVLYVSCGEAFAPPATATGSPCHLPAAKSPLEAVKQPLPAIVEPPPPWVPEAAPPAAAEPTAVDQGGNAFDMFSLDDATAAAAAAAAFDADTTAATAATTAVMSPISEEATRDYVQVRPSTVFSYLMRGGGKAAAGKGGMPFYLKKIGSDGEKSSNELFEFGKNPEKYLQVREAAPSGAAVMAESSDPGELQPLVMGEWEQVPVPPAEARKDKNAVKMGFKPSLSALKAVFKSKKRRQGIAVRDYPPDAELMKVKVEWHDFKSVVSVVHKMLKAEEAALQKEVAKEVKPTSDDMGGVQQLGAKYLAAESKRIEKAAMTQSRWSKRDTDIDARLQEANDVLQRAEVHTRAAG